MYELDLSCFFTHNILVYKLFGFWKPDKDMKYKNIYRLYTLLCTTIWVSYLLSQVIYIYINVADVEEVTATLYVAITFSIDLIKMIAIYVNMDDIKLLIKDLNKPLFQVKCKQHHDSAKAIERLNKIVFYSCLYLGTQTDVLWSIVPFLGNERVTLSRGWFPYDWKKSPNYELTYLFQNAVTVWNNMICINLDTFAASLMMQVGLQCDFLNTTLNCLDDFCVENGILRKIDEKQKEALKKDPHKYSEMLNQNLVVCVCHHREIMKLAKTIENIHKTSVFILFIGGALIISSCLLQLSMVGIGTMPFIMLLLYVICMLTEQFLYCWFGNEVLYKSTRLLRAAYNTPWVECNRKFRMNLLQFMTQLKRPIGIKAGGLFQMSLDVFTSVIRTSYSYFTLLQRIREE